MKPLIFSGLTIVLGAGLLAGSDLEQKAHERLEWMRKAQRGMWNVSPEDGQFLAGMVRKVEAQRVLEVGTSNGYSGIWIALGLRDTGGKLITLEVHEGRRKLALENFEAAGVMSLIDSRLNDALEEIPQIEGPLDLVFLDAAKNEYLSYLEAVLPKVRSGGVILAHNVVDLENVLRDYIEAVKKHPELETEIVTPGPAGFAVSVKK